MKHFMRRIQNLSKGFQMIHWWSFFQVPEYAAEQERWLDAQLALSQEKKAVHTLVFQHIPWFVNAPDEDKIYFNVEPVLRKTMLEKFKKVPLKSTPQLLFPTILRRNSETLTSEYSSAFPIHWHKSVELKGTFTVKMPNKRPCVFIWSFVPGWR